MFAAVDLPDIGEDLDLTLRHVTRRFPEHLARALLPAGTVVTSARCSETQVTSRQRRLDRGLEVVVDGEQRLEHIEWQLEMSADVPFRIHEYNTLTSIALHDETPAGQDPPRIRSTVVLMSGRDKPWLEHGAYRTSPDDEPFSGVTFRIDAVYQRTVAELEARGPLWAVFTPLAVDADPVRIEAVLDKLRAGYDRREFTELAIAAAVVATKDQRHRELSRGILAGLSEEDIMQSSVYELAKQRGKLEGKLEGEREGKLEGKREGKLEGKREGKLEGKLEMFARIYERRLQRALTELERARLAQHLENLGVDRLLDAPQELSADALTAWLRDPTSK
jgi:hypothetical protein